MAKEKWISGAIKRPGALTKKAEAASQTVTQYCAGKMKGSSRTAQQCRLAKTLKGLKK